MKCNYCGYELNKYKEEIETLRELWIKYELNDYNDGVNFGKDVWEVIKEIIDKNYKNVLIKNKGSI